MSYAEDHGEPRGIIPPLASDVPHSPGYFLKSLDQSDDSGCFPGCAVSEYRQLFSTKPNIPIDPLAQSFYLPCAEPSEYGSDREDSTDSLDTSRSTDQGSSSSAIAEKRKTQVLDRLMSRLGEWLELNLQKRGAPDSQQTSSQGSASAAAVPSSSSQDSGSQGTKKRRRKNCEESGGDGDEEPVQHRPKRAKTTDTVEARYVCPFFKHNRERYQTSQWKSCCWPGWVSVHRVKEHLYRRHMLPKFRCNRCRQDLKSALNLNEHQRADIICQRQNEELQEEGIDEEHEKLLRARKRKNGKVRQIGEEGKWVEMYKILFPHDDPIPSPFSEFCPLQTNRDNEQPGASVLDSFENYARREFSRRMRPRMETLVDGILEQTLTSQAITEVANNVLQGLMQSFRASQGQATCHPEAEGSPSRSPTPQAILVEDTVYVPQDNDILENSLYSNLELNLDEILNCLDDSQVLDFEHWQTEAEAANGFQHIEEKSFATY